MSETLDDKGIHQLIDKTTLKSYNLLKTSSFCICNLYSEQFYLYIKSKMENYTPKSKQEIIDNNSSIIWITDEAFEQMNRIHCNIIENSVYHWKNANEEEFPLRRFNELYIIKSLEDSDDLWFVFTDRMSLVDNSKFDYYVFEWNYWKSFDEKSKLGEYIRFGKKEWLLDEDTFRNEIKKQDKSQASTQIANVFDTDLEDKVIWH